MSSSERFGSSLGGSSSLGGGGDFTRSGGGGRDAFSSSYLSGGDISRPSAGYAAQRRSRAIERISTSLRRQLVHPPAAVRPSYPLAIGLLANPALEQERVRHKNLPLERSHRAAKPERKPGGKPSQLPGRGNGNFLGAAAGAGAGLGAGIAAGNRPSQLPSERPNAGQRPARPEQRS